MITKNSRALALGLSCWSAACGDSGETTIAAGAAEGFPLPAGPAYATVAQVEMPQGSSTLVSFGSEVPTGELQTAGALEMPGGAEVKTHDGRLFLGDGETYTFTRYDVEADRLVERGSIGLADRGMTFMNELHFNGRRAFIVNSDQLEVIEWDTETMSVTNSYDISALEREGWGYEYRGGHLRDDGVLFFIWAYTNDRTAFINDFVVGVFDTNTGALEVIVDEACPASAGFGGFFDEVGDLYLPADSFGGFTFFDGADPKDACVRRIKAGERNIDPTYTFQPVTALGGLAPWGLYYAGQGIAYTTAVDPARLPEYDSVFSFIFDTIHEGYALDLAAGTAEKIDEMPPDAVGFESVTIEGQVLIPRSAGAVRIYEVDNVQTRVYSLDAATKVATPRFTLPGYLDAVVRVR
jgi:hypothetical protein